VRPLFVAVAVYFAALLWLNLAFIPYPYDNDLQFVGWIARHLSPSRPESFVNQNYPFGFPLLMRALVPVFGSIVKAALFCQSLASAVGLLLVFGIAARMFHDRRAAGAAAAVAAIVNFPVVITEFADPIATVALLAGLYLLVDATTSVRRHFVLGALVGVGFLFRFHFLTFLVIFPLALATLRPGLRRYAACCGALLAGFAVAASPLLIINFKVHGTPLHSGLSAYLVGQNLTDSVDWNDYPATYALWPISRILSERPGDLVAMMLKNAGSFLHPFALFALGITVAGVALSREHRAGSLYLLTVVAGYVLLNILVTRYTNRAAHPAFMLLSVLAAGHAFSSRWPRSLVLITLAGLAVGFAVHVYKQFQLVEARREQMHENQAVMRALRDHGLRSSSEVFCNDWNLYNLDDAFLEPFHDYGGYMLLDPEYAAQRPVPKAATQAEWRSFLRRHGIRFVIRVRGLPTPGIPELAAPTIFSNTKLEVHAVGGDRP
jgi:hypothetical protein